MSYWKFAAMIATSTVVMFGLMYLNTYLATHVFWSETRAYMAILMGATMAIVMLAFMMSMYPSKAVNMGIFAGAALVFAGSLWLVRSQTTVSDTSYMRAMIPHHSIAIMTSSRANIEDARVRKLADEIIFAQDKEIAEMRYLIDSIERHGKVTQDTTGAAPEIKDIAAALDSPHLAVMDPGFLTEDEIDRAFPDGASCRFAYTTESPASLAVGRAEGGMIGLVKFSGDLVRVPMRQGAEMGTEPGFEDGPLTIAVGAPGGGPLYDSGNGERQEADLTFTLADGPSAGFRGFYNCR